MRLTAFRVVESIMFRLEQSDTGAFRGKVLYRDSVHIDSCDELRRWFERRRYKTNEVLCVQQFTVLY